MQLALNALQSRTNTGAENGRSFDPADPNCLGSGCVSVRTDIDCDRRKSLKIPGTDYYINLDAAQPLNAADSQPRWPQSRTGFRKNSVYRSSIDSQKSN